MKVAIVHYWLVGMRGGEKVLEEICTLFPQADIFTLVVDHEQISEKIKSHKIHSSFLQKIGGVKHYQKMLALMPFALERFDLTQYDLVISSEAGPAKGVVTRPDAMHICYCHSPMRYIWDLEPQYRQVSGTLTRFMLALIGPLLRQWDVTTSTRVDYFIANSEYVARRIKKFYRRDSVVINPPVSLERFSPRDDIEEVYICAGQITPYKKIDVAIEAFNRTGKRLDIIGSGATKELISSAGPTIKFFGSLSDNEMEMKFARCKALIFPGVEDFGIVPLEVQASGRPVVAFARGGAVETVEEGKTGVFFHEQSAESLIEAIERFESRFIVNTEVLTAAAQRYSQGEFRRKFLEFVSSKMNEFGVAP